MKSCDPSGPLMMYVSKMVPAADRGRFYAFGRVFSGTVTSGQKVHVLGPNYSPDRRERGEHAEAVVPRVVVMIGDAGESAGGGVPCGNVCGLTGLEKYLLKTGTITTYKAAHNMKVSGHRTVRL